jgi:hypothetical protein
MNCKISIIWDFFPWKYSIKTTNSMELFHTQYIVCQIIEFVLARPGVYYIAIIVPNEITIITVLSAIPVMTINTIITIKVGSP